MTLLAGNSAYFVSSELETGPGYADIYLKRTKSNPGQFDHLIELKYLKAAELNSRKY
ncbi:MAG: PD-(D/E)XK nuclease domain-containing protein [Ignavibacteriales bacterium]|nr:PD-(D/E)XK nuclease domain-containing protein [Ignavibacteriales bacterium]